MGKETAAISTKQRLTILRYHRQSTNTPPTVDRYTSDISAQMYTSDISAEMSAESRRTYRPIVSTDSLLTRITCRPILDRHVGRHIGRYSVDISTDCRSTYRPRVSTDTWSTDALSTHDPKILRESLTQFLMSLVLVHRKGGDRCFQCFPLLFNTAIILSSYEKTYQQNRFGGEMRWNYFEKNGHKNLWNYPCLNFCL